VGWISPPRFCVFYATVITATITATIRAAAIVRVLFVEALNPIRTSHRQPISCQPAVTMAVSPTTQTTPTTPTTAETTRTLRLQATIRPLRLRATTRTLRLQATITIRLPPRLPRTVHLAVATVAAAALQDRCSALGQAFRRAVTVHGSPWPVRPELPASRMATPFYVLRSLIIS